VSSDTIRPAEHDWLATSADGGQPPDAPDAPPPRRDRSRPRRQRAMGGALALVLIGAAGGAVAGHEIWQPRAATTLTPAAGSGSGPFGRPAPFGGFGGFGGGASPGGSSGGSSSSVGAGPADAASIASQVDPAVVDVDTTVGYQNARAAGTGMVLTSTGEILTNNHVIAGATSIRVTDVGNGKTYDATVVGYDRTHDVAVLQLSGASNLATVTTAATAATVGSGVVGVGNAGGTGGTPSYAGGVITATGQSITATDASDGTSEQLTGLLETDANIVSGDSGGPLVNTKGEVVGMDTAASAGFSLSQSSQAYAIPIDEALGIARQIEAGRSSSTVHIGPTAMLGVGVEPDGSGLGSGSGSGSGRSGAVVAGVLTGGPAANAGLGAGDTIVAVDGHQVTSAAGLSRIVLGYPPATTVSVTYVDAAGQQQTANVRLASGPPQ
jgi:S1-C subfamily serine protease